MDEYDSLKQNIIEMQKLLDETISDYVMNGSMTVLEDIKIKTEALVIMRRALYLVTGNTRHDVMLSESKHNAVALRYKEKPIHTIDSTAGDLLE